MSPHALGERIAVDYLAHSESEGTDTVTLSLVSAPAFEEFDTKFKALLVKLKSVLNSAGARTLYTSKGWPIRERSIIRYV
eukprot:8848655-Pyramimonas_sp.AAC.1